ncbi:MAG: polyprenyl synthetase family protein [Simkania sp.]|nr:polyprenyl synthetase family protein [Simkania sp.]
MSISTESSKKLSHFYFLRDKIEQEIARNISSLGEKTKLRDACEYALTNGGKRFRPLIVYLISEALGHDLNVSEAALSVEFFHTASLIVDDLPCMDNDDERREKPSVHKVYGETIALLSSYALITAAFGKIQRNAEQMISAGAPFAALGDRIAMLALETASRCSGILGATGGQFYDKFPPMFTLENLRQVIYKKTVTLFEVSFVFGWLFGGGDLSKLTHVRKTAYHFGMAFQIADDLLDIEQDDKMEREINIARFVGKDRAYALFEEEMRLFDRCLIDLRLDTPSFQKMQQMLRNYVK